MFQLRLGKETLLEICHNEDDLLHDGRQRKSPACSLCPLAWGGLSTGTGVTPPEVQKILLKLVLKGQSK